MSWDNPFARYGIWPQRPCKSRNKILVLAKSLQKKKCRLKGANISDTETKSINENKDNKDYDLRKHKHIVTDNIFFCY